MMFWWVLVQFGAQMWATKTPVWEAKVGRNENPPRKMVFDKNPPPWDPSKCNRKPHVTHTSTVRFQLAIWIHGISDGPLSSARGISQRPLDLKHTWAINDGPRQSSGLHFTMTVGSKICFFFFLDG
jgi:hypothetical protein